MTAFWDMEPCSLLEVNRRFRGAYCLHHQGIRPDNRGSTQLGKVVLLLRDYTAPYFRMVSSSARKNVCHKRTETYLIQIVCLDSKWFRAPYATVTRSVCRMLLLMRLRHARRELVSICVCSRLGLSLSESAALCAPNIIISINKSKMEVKYGSCRKAICTVVQHTD
jgi:hypothetical protein